MTGAFRMVIKGRFDSPATGQHEVGAISRYPNVRDYYSVYPPSRYRTYPFDDGATGFACQCKKSNCSISPEQAAALAPCDQDPWAFKPGGWVQDTDLFRRRDLPVGEGAIRALPTYAMPYVYYMPELLWTTDNQWMSPGGYFKLKLIAGKR